jgi:hypothetical protein
MNHKLKVFVRNLSHTNKIVNILYHKANSIKMALFKNMNDEIFAKQKYYENTGRRLNLDDPQTFDEKLWWLKLHNHDPLLTICSDKYRVREYVKDCGLEYILNELHGVYDKAEDIDYDSLPNEFFMKCNHASGVNYLCKDKSSFNRDKVEEKLNDALKHNYYLQSREWNYKNIEPKIICERVLKSKDNQPLIDYRFLCFDGTVKCIFIDIDTCADDGSHRYDARRNVYDENMNLLDVKVTRDTFPPELVKKPNNFDEMKRVAVILSKPFPHCRVDLYNTDGKIFFGELTFYHAGACSNIQPEEWAYKLGSWIDLSKIK